MFEAIKEKYKAIKSYQEKRNKASLMTMQEKTAALKQENKIKSAFEKEKKKQLGIKKSIRDRKLKPFRKITKELKGSSKRRSTPPIFQSEGGSRNIFDNNSNSSGIFDIGKPKQKKKNKKERSIIIKIN